MSPTIDLTGHERMAVFWRLVADIASSPTDEWDATTIGTWYSALAGTGMPRALTSPVTVHELMRDALASLVPQPYRTLREASEVAIRGAQIQVAWWRHAESCVDTEDGIGDLICLLGWLLMAKVYAAGGFPYLPCPDLSTPDYNDILTYDDLLSEIRVVNGDLHDDLRLLWDDIRERWGTSPFSLARDDDRLARLQGFAIWLAAQVGRRSSPYRGRALVYSAQYMGPERRSGEDAGRRAQRRARGEPPRTTD